MNKFTYLFITMILLTACGGGGGGGESSPPESTPATTASPSPLANEAPTNDGSEKTNALLDLEYGRGATKSGSIPLLLDIYQPAGNCDSNRPTILFVHGGGFINGDKSGNAGTRSKAANAKGINYVSMNYRLVRDNSVLSSTLQPVFDNVVASDPTIDAAQAKAATAAIEDTVAALNWLEANADEYCIDMTSLAYWGSSAGSLTVLNVAYSGNNLGLTRPEPSVVIDYWGRLNFIADMESMEAPFLIIHGDNDQTVDYQSALDLSARADLVGIPYAFYTEIGGGHGINPTKTVNGKNILDLTIEFIEAHIVGGIPLYETANID
jgi:acetyl esterase/lipase